MTRDDPFGYAGRGMRIVEPRDKPIDYRRNLLGVRVWKHECQLIARGSGTWEALGPMWPLPLEFPSGIDGLKQASTDTLRLTAWQFDNESPGTDLRAVLSRQID